MPDVTQVLETTRRSLGPIGVLLPVSFNSVPPSAVRQREAVLRLERSGYGAAWTNEVVGKDALVHASLLLGATRTLALGTAIANIWLHEPHTLHVAASQLAEAYPGRFVLGVGVGYPEQANATGREFGRPLTTMRQYLQQMDGKTMMALPEAGYPRIVAANGPRMLELAAEMADGALPAGQPPGFTERARHVLGADKLLVVALSLPQEHRDDASAVPVSVREHLEAGADHVALMPAIGAEYTTAVDRLERLAATLGDLR